MNTLKLAMLAAAGLGLVSQTAFADTLPGQAVPSSLRAHKATMVRFADKRHGEASNAVEAGTVIIGLAGAGALVVGIVEATKSNNSGSTGV